MSEQITEADTIDPETGMSPREAAEKVLAAGVGDVTSADVLADPFFSATLATMAMCHADITLKSATMPAKRTLRNWHARQSAALLEENKRLKDVLAALHYGKSSTACDNPDCQICALVSTESEQPR